MNNALCIYIQITNNDTVTFNRIQWCTQNFFFDGWEDTSGGVKNTMIPPINNSNAS